MTPNTVTAPIRVAVEAHRARLSAVDYGGRGSHVLLLHGLAGDAIEWRNTAAWLTGGFHVVALDQRGHGQSDKGLDDFSRNAYVRDAATVIEHLCLAPVILVGQSHGGVTAYLTAARYPQLVRALVVIEAGITNDADAPNTVARWLDSWPLPFRDFAAAQQFFGGATPAARAWAARLVRRDGGYLPAFLRDDMLASVRDHESTATYESDWAAVACPTLLVVGERGWIRASDVETMRALQPKLCVVNIPGAGHDVHLEAPSELRRAAEAFFSGLPDA